MNPTTAILFFSRTAAAEATLKFGRHGTDGRRLAAGLITRTRHTLRRSGLPVFRCDERQQSGATFGERITHSLEGIFTRGYRHVIVVGNDCPELTAALLRSAAQSLHAGQSVIGRDGRGGIYLLGISRNDFDAPALRAVRWQSPYLADDLCNLLRRARETCALRDLNRMNDLRAHWQRWKHLLGRLSYLVHRLELPPRTKLIVTERTTHRRAAGRAPPVAA